MNISVFGLGYVGCVTAACLAEDGHRVIGIDVDRRKVDSVCEGTAPFFEPGLAQLLQHATRQGNLTASTNGTRAIASTDVALICVGTPTDGRGRVNLDYLRNVLTSIGKTLRGRTTPFVVVLRSTVLPHIVEHELIPLLESAVGKRLGEELGFCCNPEFLREGTAVRDFYESPLVVIGRKDEWAGAVVAKMYEKVAAPVSYTDISTACLVKYVCNVFHALKVAFANEVGHLGDALNVDGRQLMDIICQDTKLNIAATYLKPGFAFGGSCLPKDLRAVVAESRRRAVRLPIIDSILPSNELHLHSCIDSVLQSGAKKIGLYGLAFKENTDDLRESPAVEMAETLIGKGIEVMIYEPAIAPGTIHGANLRFIESTIPHIWKLLVHDFATLVRDCEAVILLKRVSPVERQLLSGLRGDQLCLDFAGAPGDDKLTSRGMEMATPQPSTVASPAATAD